MPTPVRSRRRVNFGFRRVSLIVMLCAVIGWMGYYVYQHADELDLPFAFTKQTLVKEVQMPNGITLRVYNTQKDADLIQGPNQIFLQFFDSKNQKVNVGKVEFELTKDLEDAHLRSIGIPSWMKNSKRYKVQTNLQATGVWNARISFSGSAGTGEASFLINVKPRYVVESP